MTKQLKQILRGVGSVMDICPSSDYTQFIPRESKQERMQGHFVRVGEHLTIAAKRFANEQSNKTNQEKS